MRNFLLLSLGALAVVTSGCSNMEYAIREKFGQQKRELLVARVQDAKEGQEAAKVEFVDALTTFKNLTGFKGGDLEEKFEEVKASYDDCVKQADRVREQIGAVQDVAQAMFREWKQELDEYSSPELRKTSERQLQQTQQAYDKLINVMDNAGKRMTPVLAALKDQVLFLKHNLNARAIASLGDVSAQLQRDVNVLIRDMQRAIDDAARFITQMQASGS